MTTWSRTAGLAAALFGALTLVAALGGVSTFERGLHDWLVGFAGAAAPAAVFHGLNMLGAKAVLIPAAVVLALPPLQFRRRWWLVPAALLATAGLEDLAKVLIARPRPAAPAPGFPSGHASAAAAFYVAAAGLAAERIATATGRRLIWVAAAAAILLVMAGRVAVEAHWPLDVVGGAALGTAVAAAALGWHRGRPAAPP